MIFRTSKSRTDCHGWMPLSVQRGFWRKREGEKKNTKLSELERQVCQAVDNDTNLAFCHAVLFQRETKQTLRKKERKKIVHPIYYFSGIRTLTLHFLPVLFVLDFCPNNQWQTCKCLIDEISKVVQSCFALDQSSCCSSTSSPRGKFPPSWL